MLILKTNLDNVAEHLTKLLDNFVGASVLESTYSNA